jgi:hypothetical protein
MTCKGECYNDNSMIYRKKSSVSTNLKSAFSVVNKVKVLKIIIATQYA